jgi:hypothetical protein
MVSTRKIVPFSGIDAKGFRAAPGRKVGRAFPAAEP